MLLKVKLIPLLNSESNSIKDFIIKYGYSKSKFGNCLIGVNEEKLCFMSFFEEGNYNLAIEQLQFDWPKAVLKNDNCAIEPVFDLIFNDTSPNKELDILLKGTELQIKVWSELVNLKTGVTTSYESIAKAIGKPRAVRAVANAIAKNKIAYIIPCHRIIQKSGDIGKYRWGVKRKQDMLNFENKWRISNCN